MTNGTQNIQIQVNLDAPKSELQRAIQRTIYLVSAALNSTTQIGEGHLKLPEIEVEATFDSSLKWSSAEVSQNLKEWVLQNGFRDAVEFLSVFLESIHSVCTFWSLVQRQNGGQVLTGMDWQSATESEPKKFHRLGLPDKLDHLRDTHGINVEPAVLKSILSANSARNCLVHRNGIVSEKDADSGVLVVSWKRMKLIAIDEDGEHELKTGVVYEKATTIAMKFVEESKSFNLGDSISFSPLEFQSIAWALFLFGNDLTATLSDWGIANGFVTPPPARA